MRLNRLAPARVNVYAKLEAMNPMGSVKDRLAMVCAAKGYPLVVTMAENLSVERRRLMRFPGARVVLTPAAHKGSGMLAKARELAERPGWFLVSPFDNEANADVHSRTPTRGSTAIARKPVEPAALEAALRAVLT